jgi:hypothetical protein
MAGSNPLVEPMAWVPPSLNKNYPPGRNWGIAAKGEKSGAMANKLFVLWAEYLFG